MTGRPTKDELDATVVRTADLAQPAPAAASAKKTPVPGEVFAGRYRIERELGRGGMGAVYRAVDTMVGDVVALKTLDLGQAPDEAAIDRFRREVRLARRVSHPNVARTHDLGEVDGAQYLTMELVEGTDLEHVIEAKGKLPAAQAVQIAIGVADGLAAAHAAGIVHRDLKPGNVLLEAETQRIVLTDFGIARGLVDPAASQQRTVGTVGTPLYMAPEQVRGGEVDARTDLYALGLVMYEMLTGTVPFLGDTAIATAVARLEKDAPDPRTLDATLDAALVAIVMKCLARQPSGRPASASELAAQLRGWAGAASVPALTLPPSGEAARVPTAQLPVTPTPPPGAKPTTTTRGGYRALAVLPFKYRGPKESEYLGESLTEELVDVLARARGLRVLASAATARFKDERDPQAVGGQLGVDALVDGSVQASGTQLRITARLIDVRTATQLWTDRFDAPLEDFFDVQEKLSKRIAEALRVTLDVGTHRIEAPPAAIEAYLRGRQALIAGIPAGPTGAFGLFEEALSLAPDLGAAKAAMALAALRAWFIPGLDPSRDWAKVAPECVERALRDAPDVAETHIAAAQLALQRAAFREAVAALTKAIDIAPTFAGAQASLGAIEIEAGRLQQGLKRLALAHELDPTSIFPLIDLMRATALQGKWSEVDELLAELGESEHPAVVNVRLRFAMWRGDRANLSRIYEQAKRSQSPIATFTAVAAAALLNAPPGEEIAAQLAALTPPQMSPRFHALFHQIGAEILCAIDEPELGLTAIAQAADGALIDLEWMEKCPVLAPVRKTPAFAASLAKVRARVAGVWTM